MPRDINVKVQRILSRVRLKQLQILVAVAEHGNILSAARELNISQPAATNTIKHLEDDFGVELFRRTNRGVVPTVFGDVLIRNVKLLFARLSTTMGEIEDLKDGGAGRVVVGTLPAASSLLLPQAIKSTLEQRPNVTVKVIEGNNEVLLPSLKAGELDMIVGRLPEMNYSDELEQINLFEEEVIAIVKNDHPLAGKPDIELEEMMAFGWILPPSETIVRAQLAQALRKFGTFSPSSIVESFSYLTNRRLIQMTDLIAVVPSHVATFDLSTNALTRLNFDFEMDTSYIGVSLRKSTTQSPAAAFFLDALKQVAASS
ncbi:LysR substrate-binding domain-containing protein [Shimia sediminis]|uniref:LysR substrate-binding domain-containing protein n=1 Tax=Shimia sediminis TaxID=2497945 RepID=UPI000F8CFBF9|nr:LysR substrate-binding domain-containing protein [Shimia sediminis]